MKLTGRWRYRHQRRWFRYDELVLQVEVERIEDFGDAYIGPDHRLVYSWRDAQLEDLVGQCAPVVSRCS